MSRTLRLRAASLAKVTLMLMPVKMRSRAISYSNGEQPRQRSLYVPQGLVGTNEFDGGGEYGNGSARKALCWTDACKSERDSPSSR